MNRVADKNGENVRRRRGRIDMIKTSRIQLDNFDHFMAAMARVLGIPRKKLEKFMFLEQVQHPRPRSTGQQRSANRPSSLAVK